MLEAEVHDQLREFLREGATTSWAHHLTMARIVSRALRLQRSALIQTGSSSSRYCLSYLVPALLSDRPILLVAPPPVQRHLLEVEIPRLQEWLTSSKVTNLKLADPEDWLRDRLEAGGRFPTTIPVLIDGAGDLETWTRDLLTARMAHQDWDLLLQQYPETAAAIRDLRVRLTKSLFERPKNPYECYLLAEAERKSVSHLLEQLTVKGVLPASIYQFWQQWQQPEQMGWASLVRERGQFTLHVAPVEVAPLLGPIWQQPTVLIDGFLDQDREATTYRQQLGLGEMLCLKFSPNRQSEGIQLYLPERLPLPNTPEFQGVLLQEVRTLLHLCSHIPKAAVVLVEDMPLKAQIGTQLAAEFGSRVQVEKENLPSDGILVSGWQFWHNRQADFPTPQLLIIATLPIPSLENPLVAERVAYYRRFTRQDWFRLYLLPVALREMQRAVMPLRESQGVVAILDNRVNSRSYGRQILQVLSPYARINYVEPTWFGRG